MWKINELPRLLSKLSYKKSGVTYNQKLVSRDNQLQNNWAQL